MKQIYNKKGANKAPNFNIIFLPKL